VITGASSGIGFELARLFARDGWKLVLVARDPVRLKAAAERIAEEAAGPVEVRVCNLAEKKAVEELARELVARPGGVDALINNAGFGEYGYFSEMTSAKMEEMINTNVDSLVMLTRSLLPGMLENKTGKILNVASVAGFVPGPLMAVYYATKAFVLSFSEALAEETSGTGVTISVLCPGPTKTGFADRAKVGDSDLFKGPLVQSAAAVAREAYRGMMKGKTVIVTGFSNKMMVQLIRLVPRFLIRKAVRQRQETRRKK